MNFKIFILFVFINTSTFQGKEAKLTPKIISNTKTFELSDTDFNPITLSGLGKRNWLLLFYVDYCKHCQHILPIINDFGMKFNGTNLQVGRINCEQNSELRDRFSITAYPTIIFLSKGKLYEYKGERTFEGIQNFVTNDFLLEKGEMIPMEVSLLRLLNKSFGKMFIVLVFLAVTFFILFLLCKHMNKEEDEDTLLNTSNSDDSDDQHEKKD